MKLNWKFQGGGVQTKKKRPLGDVWILLVPARQKIVNLVKPCFHLAVSIKNHGQLPHTSLIVPCMGLRR